ncbi:hypothetical protein C8J57DRAFT_1713518 [Mycena rebaudengoi]|nr:hypothetical protein C8J57DRAFT_1713518 [Mycena rebaudengoi]
MRLVGGLAWLRTTALERAGEAVGAHAGCSRLGSYSGASVDVSQDAEACLPTLRVRAPHVCGGAASVVCSRLASCSGASMSVSRIFRDAGGLFADPARCAAMSAGVPNWQRALALRRIAHAWVAAVGGAAFAPWSHLYSPWKCTGSFLAALTGYVPFFSSFHHPILFVDPAREPSHTVPSFRLSSPSEDWATHRDCPSLAIVSCAAGAFPLYCDVHCLRLEPLYLVLHRVLRSDMEGFCSPD